MKLIFDKEYISSKAFNFPADNLSQEKKASPEYFKQCTTTILHKYINNKCWLPYSDVVDALSPATLRQYAAGTNSADKYKDLLIGPKVKGQRPKSTVNISWRLLKILPQKLDVVLGYFLKMKWDSETSAVDYQSTTSKQAIVANLKLVSNDKYKLMRDELNDMMGTQVAQDPAMPEGAIQSTPLQFRNEKEVDMFSSMGGIFLEQEAAISILLETSKEQSGWDVIYSKLIKDFLVLGIGMTKTRVNKYGTIVQSDYVDPEKAIIPNSEYEDFRDMSWGGEIKRMSIAELRERHNLSDFELIEIAQKYAKADGNMPAGFYHDAQRFVRNDGFDMNMINQITVDVVECRWVGTAEETYTSVYGRDDNRLRFNRVDENKKLYQRDIIDGKEMNTYSRQVIYKCSMIVGTNHIFDYGIDEFLSYKQDLNGGMRVVFPYKVYRTETSSIVDRCVSFVDDANLSLLKLRVAKKKMPAPPNLMVKKSSLENVNINGTIFSPQELLSILNDEGILIVDDQTPWGTQAGSSRAIDTIPTDVIKQLLEWRLDIKDNIAMIEVVTGVNDVFSAQSPTSETGLGVSRIAIEATSNALYPITFCLMQLEKSVRKCEKAKWQVVSKYISEKERERLAINRALQYIKISTNLDEYDFDIKLEIAPNEDDKLALLQDIARMRDLRRQAGTGGILPSDYFLIWSMIKSGKIKQAQLILAQIEELRADEDKRQQALAVQNNMQSQKDSNQQNAENQMQLMQQEKQMDFRSQVELENVKTNNKILENRAKAQDEQKIAAVQNIWGWSSEAYSRKNK